MAETSIMLAIRNALAPQTGSLIWRNNVGGGYVGSRWVDWGLGKGSADLISCVLMPNGTGRFMGLEVKDKGRLSNEQICWARAVRGCGGFVAVVRSVDEAIEARARCLAGDSE
jgi:hypothetical protein